MPKPYNQSSNEMEVLKMKYCEKLKESKGKEEDMSFCLTKLLAPLIEGRY